MANKYLDILFQDEAILYIMPMLPMKIAILRRVLLRPFAHLPGPVNDVLILYFHQDLSP